MSGYQRYDEDFKQSLVNLYQGWKTQTQLCREYGILKLALSKWIQQYSNVHIDEETIITAKQIKQFQKIDCNIHATLRENECRTYSTL